MERLTKKQKHILQQKLCDMKRRCLNPNDKFYKDYGGRGITVCDEWADKKNGHNNFQKWAVENGWSEGCSIDRIDVNGNYEPSNCRWATSKEQANNRRNNLFITIHGKTKTAQEWADQIGISERAFVSRLNYGWNEDRLLEPRNKPLKMTKAEMTKEIKMWRSLEEQGLLLRFPCKVGDSVWLLFADGCIEEHTVSSIRIGNTVDNICFENDSYYTVWDKDYKSLNKWFFTTREEAEAAMAKMEGESNVVT